MASKSSLIASIFSTLVLVPILAHSQPSSLLPTSGPGGGSVGDLALATDGDLFAFAGALHRSTDAGWSWQTIPAAPGTNRLAAGLSGDIWAWGYDRLFRTSDDGTSWRLLPSAPISINQLAFSTAAQVFAATSKGVYVSADSGATWTPAPGLPASNAPSVVTASGATSAAIANVIYRTLNGGMTWTQVASVEGDVTALAVHPRGGYYAGVMPGLWHPPVGGIYRVGLDGTATPVGLAGHFVHRILPRPDGLVLVGSGGWCDGYNWFGAGVYCSVDGNAPWPAVGCEGSVAALACGAGGQVFAAMGAGGTDMGLIPACGLLVSSGPCTQWSKRNRGLGGATIYDLAASRTGVVYASADWSIAWSADQGTSWQEVESPLPHVGFYGATRRLAVHPDGTLFVTDSSELRRSSDRGSTWTALSRPENVTNAIVTDGGSVVAATWLGEIWRSSDRGDTWTLIATVGSCCFYMQDMAAGPLGGVAVSTDSSIALGTNDGTTWDAALPTTGRPAFAPDEHTVYVATGSDVERWVEGTSGWMEEAMPAFPAEDVAVDGFGRVYAASPTEVAWTVPGDTSWHDIGVTGSGSPYLEQRSRLALAPDGYLYWGTSRDGVYRSQMPAREPTSVGDGDGRILLTWTSSPNPSRNVTTIAFDIARSSPVNACVYDVRGRLVATLANGDRFAPGPHALRWVPAEGTPSGVYTYRIRAGDVVRSGRIVLVR